MPYVICAVGSIQKLKDEIICQQMNGVLHMLPETNFAMSLLRNRMLDYQKEGNVKNAPGIEKELNIPH